MHFIILPLFTAFLSCSDLSGADATSFLELIDPEKEHHAVLFEFERLLGVGTRNVTDYRIGRLVELLKPTFHALPKNERGRIGTGAANYALHRLFVREHGWFVKGLHASNGTWAESTPMDRVGGQADEHSHALLARQLYSLGFGLQELALFAVAIENTIHGEKESVLQTIYQQLGHMPEARLSSTDAANVIDVYMASYILGLRPTETTPQQLITTIEEQHPTWHETRQFLRDVEQDVLAHKASAVSFTEVSRIVEEAAARFGRWQSRDCMAMKVQLMQMQDIAGSGRVSLANFYHGALHGEKWQFSETVEYLRQLGALDESNPAKLHVIIPNYINSPSNCLASSSFYAVCCINECDDLLQQLENKIGGPSASPDQIVSAVSNLPPSSATPGNWKVEERLMWRLSEVADYHGSGQVPLHGRLFAQWMHHVYPQECAYPHLSGTTQPRRPEEFEEETDQDATATEEEMLRLIQEGHQHRSNTTAFDELDACSSMWVMEEELVVPEASSAGGAPIAKRTHMSRFAMHCVAVIGAVASLTLALAAALAPARASWANEVDWQAASKNAARLPALRRIHSV
mmetsp:Transcript_28877/g.55735  ORF Transcript_28877/g.55735 Transcript_28877/m.55735 type:complete len:575 (-) Transcript_28877:46-1770(-)